MVLLNVGESLVSPVVIERVPFAGAPQSEYFPRATLPFSTAFILTQAGSTSPLHFCNGISASTAPGMGLRSVPVVTYHPAHSFNPWNKVQGSAHSHWPGVTDSCLFLSGLRTPTLVSSDTPSTFSSLGLCTCWSPCLPPFLPGIRTYNIASSI